MRSKRYEVLIVCTGNQCRSPMAEGLLKQALIEEGFTGIDVRSAGTMTVQGIPPAENSVAAMHELNIDISALHSTPLTSKVVESADLILTMEAAHSAYIRRKWPEAAGKVHMLRGFNGGVDEDIADPIGLDLEAYRTCRDILRVEIDRITGALIEQARDEEQS